MEEVNTMIKIAGIKSNDKINFKEFVDFFYKADWEEHITRALKFCIYKYRHLTVFVQEVTNNN